MMVRTQISLSHEERRVLDMEARRTGRSIASLIRDAIQVVYGAQRSAEDDLVAMQKAFGSWQDHDLDGQQWVDRLRTGSRLPDRP